MTFPLAGTLLLLGRVVALGFERPAFKALARERDSVAATALNYALALVLLLPLLAVALLRGADALAGLSGWWLLAVVSGLVAFAGYNLNMAALGRGEVGVLGPVYSSGLVWLYGLEIAFGSARFTWTALLAILLVVAGLALLGGGGGFHGRELLNPLRVLRAPGALAMLLSALLLGVVRVIDKQAAATAPQIGYACLATLPVVALSLLLLVWRGRGTAPWALLAERPAASWGSALAHTGGYLILLGAYRYYDASVVEPVGQLSLLLNLWIGALWFGEPLRGRWLPTLLVIAGAALLLFTVA